MLDTVNTVEERLIIKPLHSEHTHTRAFTPQIYAKMNTIIG